MKKGNELKLKSVTKVTKKSVFFSKRSKNSFDFAFLRQYGDAKEEGGGVKIDKSVGGGKIDNRP